MWLYLNIKSRSNAWSNVLESSEGNQRGSARFPVKGCAKFNAKSDEEANIEWIPRRTAPKANLRTCI